MSQVKENNKLLVKNTMFLYLRMVLIMFITLFTSRIVLRALGEEGYGIYSVVGGVVAMFSFFTGTLASTSQRYFSYYVGNNKEEELVQSFRLNVTFFLILGFFIFILAETFGLWFINTKLNIPDERVQAMNIVYQCSIISFLFAIILIPYNALIISYERMSAFAYISIFEVLLKLGLTILLLYIDIDKLILYSILMLFSQILTTLCYYLYCSWNFKKVSYTFYWNKAKIIDIMSYSGWHIIGTLSVMIRNQGVNILLNTFFNPIVNAGRTIGFQVTTAIDSLSNNFFLAAKPQIYKYYALGKIAELHKLMMRSSKICVFLITIIAIPVMINTEYLLSLWLVDVPTYAIIFTQLSIINGVIDSTNGPAIAAALATARIKWFEIITGGIMILNLPISFILLKICSYPEVSVFVSIFLSLLTILIRAFILERLVSLPFKKYVFNTCFLSLIVSVIIYVLVYILSIPIKDSLIKLIISVFLSILLCIILFFIIVLDKDEKEEIKTYILEVLNKCYIKNK